MQASDIARGAAPTGEDIEALYGSSDIMVSESHTQDRAHAHIQAHTHAHTHTSPPQEEEDLGSEDWADIYFDQGSGSGSRSGRIGFECRGSC